MQLRVQHSSSVSAGNGILVREDGDRFALLFLRAGDAEALKALTGVFKLHQAPTAEVCQTVPHLDRTAGDCVIRDDGILVTLQAVDPADWNKGQGMLGLNLELIWGKTSSEWRQAARETGFAWACLLAERQYLNAVSFEAGTRVVDVTRIPPAPVLKLDALPGG